MAMRLATLVLLACVVQLGEGIQLDQGNDDHIISDYFPAQLQQVSGHMAKLLQIREQMERVFTPFSPAGKEVQDLGDGTPSRAAMAAQDRREKRSLTYALLELDKSLTELEQHDDSSEALLGEAVQRGSSVDPEDLNKLLDPAPSRSATRTVRGVVRFLADARKLHEALTRSELDQIRQFYIDQTAATLARYGFEQSPFGHPDDVSQRMGDYVAARQHMDDQDELVHSDDSSAGPTNKNVEGVLKSLRETAYLSEFLDRVAEDSQEIRDTPTDSSSEDQLEALQSDEEKITDGLEKLLGNIKDGTPVESAEGSLQDRADAVTDRLKNLQKEIFSAADEPDHAVRSSKKEKLEADVRVPLPVLRSSLNHVISTTLDKTLRKFRMMRSAGMTVDPELRRKIEQYMSRITSHLLRTCVSYEQWDQPEALQDELRAVGAGNPDRLSGLNLDTHLESKKLVHRFLQRQRAEPAHKSLLVPVRLKQLMGKGVWLDGVGHFFVTVHH